MARVAQSRSGPPYLLIIFVFLFLIATTLAVLFYMNADKKGRQLAELEETQSALANRRQLDDPLVRQYMQQSGTVLGQMRQQMDQLVQIVTGTPGDPQEAIDQAEAAFEAAGRTGLAPQVISLQEQLDESQQLVADLQADLEQKSRDLLAKDEQIRQLSETQAQALDELNVRVARITQQSEQREQEQQQILAETRKEYENTLAERERRIADLNQTAEQLQTQNRAKDTRISKLEDTLEDELGALLPQVKKFRNLLRSNAPDAWEEFERQVREAVGAKGQGVEVAAQPDGKVLRILPEQDICYIDIGQTDNVRPELTFTVYPSSGIPQDGEGKGALVVTNVGEHVSECRIVRESPDRPILEGDLVANVAFEKGRQYTFVVEGGFNVPGESSDQLGKEQVKAMIRRFGGEVADELTVQTDFLVVGTAPLEPPEPGPAAPAQVQQVYQERMEAFRQYRQIVDRAVSLHVPILNRSRFLAMVGQQPTAGG